MHTLEVKNKKIQLGDEKYPNWKLVMRNSKLVIGNVDIGNEHGPSGPPHI